MSKITDQVLKEMITKINQRPQAEKVKLIGLSKLLDDIYRADEAYSAKNNQVNFEAHSKLKTLYNDALEIMANKKQFDAANIANLSEFFTAEEMAAEEFKKTELTAPVKEHLWLHLFDQAPMLVGFITDQDREVLKSLVNVELFLSQESDGFRIEFTFLANDFFTNDKLSLEVVCDDETEEIVEIKSTEIQWKAGKDIRNVEIEKKQKNKKSGQTRVTKKLERTESFFWIFKNHSAPEEDEEEEDEELGQDPLSDNELFYNAVDAVTFFKECFFTFFIPASYGVEIKEFMDPAMMDMEAAQAHIQDAQGKGDAKPECKQQ